MRQASAMRRVYLARFAFRLLAAAGVGLAYLLDRGQFALLRGMAFFQRPSPLHLLWAVWLGDMVLQLVPVRRGTALGSRKQFARYYAPSGAQPETGRRDCLRESGRGAALVFLLWLALTLGLGGLYLAGVLGAAELFLCVTAFYVCDLICVLFWCPFRALIMKNRCCTTCRIFNWDHLMMFSVFAFVPGFYTWSLFLVSLLVFAAWEARLHARTERFREQTNRALRCGACTDRLCGRPPRDGGKNSK